jgi:hypothetical protein
MMGVKSVIKTVGWAENGKAYIRPKIIIIIIIIVVVDF